MGHLFQPPDAREKLFMDGMKARLTGEDSPERWRWHPGEGQWHSYPTEKYALEDIGVTATATPAESTFVQVGGSWQFAYKARSDMDLRSAYREIDRAFGAMRERFPHAVWNGRSGEWRGAMQRVQAPPPTNDRELPEEARKRIARVREAERDGYLTRDQAAKLIADIVAEYT